MGNDIRESFKNASDLRTHQYKAYELSADDTVTKVNATTDNVVCIQLNKPNAGERLSGLLMGPTKFKAGGTITAGNRLKHDANGTFVTANSGDNYSGRAFAGVASGGIFRGVFYGIQAQAVT